MLDVGTGRQDTIEFLTRYRCRVYFLDLDEVAAGNQADCAGAFAAALAEYPGELFDVCLFWDFLHRLNAEQLQDLSFALEPYVYSQTRAHSIAHFLTPIDFRIRGINELAAFKGKPRFYAPWSQTRFAQSFSALNIAADELSLDGCLEMLLSTE